MSLCIRILTSEIEQVLCFGLPPDIQQVGTYGQKVEITFFCFGADWVLLPQSKLLARQEGICTTSNN